MTPLDPVSGTMLELIAFRVAEQEFCVDIMGIREIRGWTAATPLPQSPPFVCGVVNLRGSVLPIIDLAARLGFPAVCPTERHVIIVAQIGRQVAGLLVDAVSDILTTGAAAVQATPNIASDTIRSMVRGLLALDGRMISLIALDNLLPSVTAEAA